MHQYLLLSKAQADLTAAQAEVRGQKATNAGLKAQAKARKAAEQAHNTRTLELQHATETHRDWADAPVPDAIWDSLFGPQPAPTAR